ncbi:MAG: hypothetical protein QNJ98_01040 [Planctomycetota bacterium]|nr:hypothetical protein [Planctomycetota bacterium]
MLPSASRLPTTRVARLRRALGRFATLGLALGVLATAAPAGADGPSAGAAQKNAPVTPGSDAPQQPLELSPYELAGLLRNRMAAYTVTPRATTRESSVRSAWRVGLKPRARRMLARMDRVADSKRWDVRGATPDTWAPTSETTARTLRELASLYVEIDAAQRQMAKARVVEQQVLQFGHIRPRAKRQPTREMEVNGYQGQAGFHLNHVFGGGPTSIGVGLQSKVRRVRVKIYDREVEQFLAEKRQAKIDAQVAAIRARIDAYTNALGKDLELVRTLTASLQLAEEMRLATAAAELEDAAQRAEARDLLDQMKVGRIEARRTAFEKASRFGTSLRRDWLQKRAKLMKLLEA